jgi:hypothetical protein
MTLKILALAALVGACADYGSTSHPDVGWHALQRDRAAGIQESDFYRDLPKHADIATKAIEAATAETIPAHFVKPDTGFSAYGANFVIDGSSVRVEGYCTMSDQVQGAHLNVAVLEGGKAVDASWKIGDTDIKPVFEVGWDHTRYHAGEKIGVSRNPTDLCNRPEGFAHADGMFKVYDMTEVEDGKAKSSEFIGTGGWMCEQWPDWYREREEDRPLRPAEKHLPGLVRAIRANEEACFKAMYERWERD